MAQENPNENTQADPLGSESGSAQQEKPDLSAPERETAPSVPDPAPAPAPDPEPAPEAASENEPPPADAPVVDIPPEMMAASESDSPAADSEMPSLPDFSGMLAQAAAGSIDLLNDVELNVKIELGRAEMTVDEILRLSEGAVVELNKLAGDPVDVLVNEQLVARGEILVVNDNFCVRVNEIVPGISERAASGAPETNPSGPQPTPGPTPA